MKKFNSTFGFVLLIILLIACNPKIENAKTVKVTVYGNCGMCKKTIEKAANKSGIVESNWDPSTKILVVTFDKKKTNLEKILKKIASVGYDSEDFRSRDVVYKQLHSCCQYDRPNPKE